MFPVKNELLKGQKGACNPLIPDLVYENQKGLEGLINTKKK